MSNKIKILLTVSVIVIGLLAIIFKTNVFHVKFFNVQGNTNTNISSIYQIADSAKNQNIFFVNIDNLQQRLKTDLPYVKNAWVQKKLPDTLFIKIEEYQPFAIVNYNNKNYIVNEKGLILSNFDKGSEINLPLIYSNIQISKIPIADIKNISDSLNQRGPDWVVESYKYLGDNQLEIDLPSWRILTLTTNNFDDNFYRIEQVHEKLSTSQCPVLDIRFNKTLCVTH